MFLYPNRDGRSFAKFLSNYFLRALRFGFVAIALLPIFNLKAVNPQPVDAKVATTIDLKSAVEVETKPKVEAPSKWVKPLVFERLSKQAKISAAEDQRWLL